jgi:hypothetical protein
MTSCPGLYQGGQGKIAIVQNRDWRTAAVLFIVISSVYYATVAGITSSNDGSHYALVRALVDKRSFEISEYLDFTEHQDYSLNGGLRFSDRPPGTALMAAPLDAASVFLPPPITPVHSKHDFGNPHLAYTLMLPVAAAAATAIILFWILRAHFGLSSTVSVLTTLAFAFGTINWKYGSTLYSHATSGLIIMLVIAFMLHWQTETSKARHFMLGLLLGFSVLTDYTNLIFVAAAGVYWLFIHLTTTPRQWGSLLLVVGGLIPGAFLMWYNTVNFGGPFELSTFNVDLTIWPQNESFFHDFATPIWVGLPAMLFYAYDNQGLFWLAPISLLGLLGLAPLWRKSRREFFVCVGLFTGMLLLFSTSTTFNPYTNDGRYITPFLGLWFVAVGFGVTKLTEVDSPLRQSVLYGLLFLSVLNQIMHIAFSWGHDLDPAALRPWAAAPENILAVLQAVFPNVLNLPIWWGILVVAGLLSWLWFSMRQRTSQDYAKA